MASHTCEITGLRLVQSRHQRVFRVAKYSWGALNPPVRLRGSLRAGWGRYDVEGSRTAYVASSRRASLAETLAYLSPSLGMRSVKLSEAFDDVDATDPRTLLEAVRDDWEALFLMPPEKIVYGWQEPRNLYELRLPATGWFIDIEHADSLSALNRQLPHVIAEYGLRRLTRAELCGDNRGLTAAVAQWVRSRTLFDGNLPHGISYDSKHGSGWRCYAVWLRALDDGFEVDREPTKVMRTTPVDSPELADDLTAIASQFGLKMLSQRV